MENIVNFYAISDLHLPGNSGKTMDIFGPAWESHQEKIAASWDASVGQDDVVLLPGDFSWAMKLKDTEQDFAWLAQRPGVKVMIKGNHDFWWNSVSKVRDILPENVHVIQNDSWVCGDIGFGGTRLWDDPDVMWPYKENKLAEQVVNKEKLSAEENETILNKELDRLEQSLISIPDSVTLRIALIHFPPISSSGAAGRAVEVLSRHSIDICVFGHFHNTEKNKVQSDTFSIQNITFHPVSADFIHFKPKLVFSY